MTSQAMDSNTPETKKNGMIKFSIKLIIGLIIGFGIALIKPPQGLTVQAMWFLGILCAGIYFIAVNIAEEHIVGILMLVFIVGLKVVDFKTAFSGYSTGTWFLVLGAFGIGAALSKTGLLTRISVAIAKKFPATFRGRVSALMVAGMVVAPTMPSTSAKSLILTPLSVDLGGEMGYKPKSRPATGLFMASWLPNGLITTLFFSGMVFGPLLAGMVQPEYRDQFTWIQWFVNALPWAIVTIIGLYIAILVLYKPKESDIAENIVVKESIAASPMSKNEKISLSVLVLTLLLWITGKWTGLSNEIVAMFAFASLALFKVIDKKDLGSRIAWNALIFLGAIFGLSSMFSTLKIDKWFSNILSGVMNPLLSKTVLFIIILCIAVYLLRSIILSQTVAVTLFFLVLAPLVQKAGINAWVLGFIIACSINVWHLFPQNVQFLTGYYAADGGNWASFPETAKMSFIFMIVNIIALLVSIPYWKLLGLL
ncbi:MAG: Inner membrane protein YbhI [Pelotomaculum sp. PtaB.Bin104]|nr:MAG: Inner membrane protein YbhI [Pelotomaculum sp. PtaB.Bin104]